MHASESCSPAPRPSLLGNAQSKTPSPTACITHCPFQLQCQLCSLGDSTLDPFSTCPSLPEPIDCQPPKWLRPWAAHCCLLSQTRAASGHIRTQAHQIQFDLQLGEHKLEDEEEVGAELPLHPEHHLAPALADDLAALGGSVQQLTVQVSSVATAYTCSAPDCQVLPEN
jgi:hypothetical protein